MGETWHRLGTVVCPKCGRVGVLVRYRPSRNSSRWYLRVVHGRGDICYLGPDTEYEYVNVTLGGLGLKNLRDFKPSDVVVAVARVLSERLETLSGKKEQLNEVLEEAKKFLKSLEESKKIVEEAIKSVAESTDEKSP
jgi:hypothetical protein